MTRFRDGKPFYQEKDTNFDGKNDLFTYFDPEGIAEKIEEDTRHTDRIDRIRTYRKGEPVKVTYDADGDGFMETVTLFEKGKPSFQTQDRDRDGKADLKIFFDKTGRKSKVESDTRWKETRTRMERLT
jgi:hypothetical protein